MYGDAPLINNPITDGAQAAGPVNPSVGAFSSPGSTDPFAAINPPQLTALTDTPAPAAPSLPSPNTDELLSMKQSALQQLSPLVSHLDQSPEEKFRTTMMMIQASDDQTLLKSAYESAQQITDEKVKAQALLDIVNEINYFTQHHSK